MVQNVQSKRIDISLRTPYVKSASVFWEFLAKYLLLRFKFLKTMKNFYLKSSTLGYLCLLFICISSCKSSSEFASSGMVQKRKYTKGYHLNLKSPTLNDRNSRYAEISEDSFSADLNQEKISSDLLEASVEPITPAIVEQKSVVEEQKLVAPHQSRFQKMGNFRMRILDRSPAPPMSADDPEYYQQVYGARKTPGLAIAGFISAILGIFVAGIPLGILAIIFGAVSLAKINGDPMRYSGKGLAIAAIIIGAIAIVGALIVISMAAAA